MLIDQSTYDRFMAKVIPEPNSGCWLWDGGLTHNGYGAFFAGKQIGAHVFSYLAHKGEIPAGLVVHHKCNLPCCVNPTHLETITQLRNLEEGRKLKTATRRIVDRATVTSFRHVIKLWPTIAILANELSVKFWTVDGWRHRNSIHGKHWLAISIAAQKRGYDFVTPEFLSAIAAKKLSESRTPARDVMEIRLPKTRIRFPWDAHLPPI